MTRHILGHSLLAIALMAGCKSGTDTNTKANQRPEADEGATRPPARKAVEPPTPSPTGDRSVAADGGVGDATVPTRDGGAPGGDGGRMKAETPFDDESSPPPIDAGD